MVLGYGIAYAMTHSTERQRRWMLLCILLSFWLSPLVRAFAWVTLLRADGPINKLLMSFGLLDKPLSLVRNEVGVLIGMVHYMIPYAVLPMYTNMQSIDLRLIAAARGLGASPFMAFWQVFYL